VVLRVRYDVDGPSFKTLNIADDDIARMVGKFKLEFPDAVRSIWDGANVALKPSGLVGTHFKYKIRTRIVEDASNPHTVIDVSYAKAGAASNVEKDVRVED